MIKIIILIFLVIHANAKDYCQHPDIKPMIEKRKKILPIKIDEATTLYNFLCIDSTYLYYVIVDLSQYTSDELKASYIFNQNQADSFYKSTKGKLKVRYIIHKIDGTIIKIINSKN